MQPFLAGAIRSGGSKVNLKSMSIDKLSKLKDQVDTILRTKVADERRTLQAELGKLSRLSTSQLRSKGLGLGVRGPVAPIETDSRNRSHDLAPPNHRRLTAPTSMALSRRWRSRPQHQVRTSQTSAAHATALAVRATPC